jgi:hypothetical protein
MAIQVLKCDYWEGGACSVTENRYAEFEDFVLGADKGKGKGKKNRSG